MEITKELYELFDTLGRAALTKWGQEINDPRPLFVPGHVQPLSITEQIQRLMRVELSKQAMEQGLESYDEADDLDDDDDDDAPLSKYQDLEEEAPLMKPERISGKKVDDGLDEAPRPEEAVETPAADPDQALPVGGSGRVKKVKGK